MPHGKQIIGQRIGSIKTVGNHGVKTNGIVIKIQMPLLLQEKKVDGLIILGDMTKPYIEKIEKEGGVP